ncbi:MAG: response regulator [Lachnospiraceae bacterium]|nr:response regulator [Lachnospiraceae bacterium]
MKNSILFIEGSDGFIPKAIIKKLKEARFEITCIPDNVDDIANNRNKAEMIIYYVADDSEQVLRSTEYLLELMKTEHKSLCLAGDPFNMSKTKKLNGYELINGLFPRPINIDNLVIKMQKLTDSHREFHREKNILIIDDDNDFLKVMFNWLKYTYKVDCVHSGTEALKFLERFRPDLILLDYEMPEFDGYQVLDQVRRNPLTSQVPIIFLTGKNDKESVMRIIKRKPDGYLLKSMRKDELLYSLDKFFKMSIFPQHDK